VSHSCSAISSRSQVECARRSRRQTTQHVLLAHLLEQLGQLGPVTLGAGDLLLADPPAASRLQGIELQGEILLLGRDPGVADQHATSRNSSGGYLIGQQLSRYSFRMHAAQQPRAGQGSARPVPQTAGYCWRIRRTGRKYNLWQKTYSHHGANPDENRILVLPNPTIMRLACSSFRLIVISPTVSVDSGEKRSG
jgi:hypothetical protein